mgnify:CR=1 FL=1|jgi:hypothetical protein
MIQPFVDSTEIQHDSAALRERMQEDGYLYVRGVFPRDEVEAIRLHWLGLLREAGCVDHDAPLSDGIADLNGFCVEPEAHYMKVLVELYRLPKFLALLHHPNIIDLLGRLLDAPVLPHPKVIPRYIFPQKTEFTTPAHQDWFHIQGTEATYTAWVPFSDLTEEMGGLQVCAGSHRSGVYQVRPTLGAGAVEVTGVASEDWRFNPVGQGDLILFHSMVVHQGMPCCGNRLRLSTDARYQSLHEPVSKMSLTPHVDAVAGWDEIYHGWPDDEPIRYYWQQLPLDIVDHDPSYIARRNDMAIEMGEAGDRRALSALQRIACRDADPQRQKQAERLIRQLEAQGH